MSVVRKIKASLVTQPIDEYVGEESYMFYDVDTGSLRIWDGTPGGRVISGVAGGLSWLDVSNKPNPTITLSGDVSGSVTLSELESGEIVTTATSASGNFTVADTISTVALQFSNVANRGKLTWNPDVGTMELTMGDDVVQQVGQEVYYPLMANETGGTISNGTPVFIDGPSSLGDYAKIVPAIANGLTPDTKYIGVATQDIPHNTVGRITYFGDVSGIDTSAYTIGTPLFVSSTVVGGLTDVAPVSPARQLMVGTVSTSGIDGKIAVRRTIYPEAITVAYNNDESQLNASNVQSALDELEHVKADIDMIQTNLTLYPTTASSDIGGFNRLISDISDPDYDDDAVAVGTGPISGNGQLVGQLISDAGILTGNPGVVTVTTVGNISKTAAKNDWAEFYFTVSKRDESGAEELVATSLTTGAVFQNAEVPTVYQQFSASAILNNGSWTITDRIILRFYANALDGTASEYAFQFGGLSPVRTQIPVPITAVVGSITADHVIVDNTNFSNILSVNDDDIQAALETIDVIGLGSLSDVVINSVSSRDVVVYNGTHWVNNQTINEVGSIASVTDTTTISLNSSPVITDGTEIWSKSVTVANNDTDMQVSMSITVTADSESNIAVLVFRDSTCIGASIETVLSGDYRTISCVVNDNVASSGTYTYSARIAGTAGTWTVNPTALLGGKLENSVFTVKNII